MNAAQELVMPLTVETREETDSPSGGDRPRLALVPEEDGRPAFLQEVDQWPSRVHAVWEALTRTWLLRRPGVVEASWRAYDAIMRGKVPLPDITVHQLPGGGFPRWAARLPTRVTWVYCHES